MIKGVNQNIIEINNTNDQYIKKAILFIDPKFSKLEQEKLLEKTNEYMKQYYNSPVSKQKNLTKKLAKKKTTLNKKQFIYSATFFIFGAATILSLATIF